MSKIYISFKRIITFTIIAAALNTGIFAQTNQLRNYVGIVRQKYSNETISKLEKNAQNLRTNGYAKYAEYIEGYIQNGTFGSGFIYVSPNGTNYIITNRHVINYDSASIEFENAETGKITKYDNLILYAIDDKIDIAILKFPDNQKPFTKGLSFSNAKLSDGTEVFSAGFPGLGNQPVWQLGKGIITNAYARIPELLNPDISTIIQHSAEVDSGNSGGPLLIQNNSTETGFSVVGINTWKAILRQGANYSIPIDNVRNFISKKEKKSNSSEIDLINEMADNFISEINKTDCNIDKIALLISTEAALNIGTESFIQILRFGPNKVRENVLAIFLKSPIEGFKYALAAELIDKYAPEEETDSKFKLNSISKNNLNNDGTIKISAKFGTQDKLIFYRIENGISYIYEITESDGIRKEEKIAKENTKKSNGNTKSNVYIDSPTTLDIRAGGTFNFQNSKTNAGINAGIDIWFDYVGFSISDSYLISESRKANIISACVAGRIPVCITNDIFLSPFIKWGFAYINETNMTDFGLCFEAGIESIYTGFTFIKPGIGASFTYSNAFFSRTFNTSNSFSNLNVYFKIGF